MFGLFGILSLTLAKSLPVMSLIPLTEGGGIDLDDGSLNQSLGTNKFVVTGIVDNIDDTGLAADGLTTPGETARIETESTVLDVTSTDTDGMDTLGTELGVGRLTTKFELSLLTVESTLGTSGRSLVAAVSANTYDEKERLISVETVHKGWMD